MKADLREARETGICFQKYACNYHENSSHFLETAAYSGNLATDSTMSSYDSWSKKTIFFFFFALMAVVQCVPQFVDMTRTRSNLNPAPILEQFCDILEMVSSKFRTGLLSTRCFFICFFPQQTLRTLKSMVLLWGHGLNPKCHSLT